MADITPLRTDRHYGDTLDENDLNGIAGRVNFVAALVAGLKLDDLSDVIIGNLAAPKYLAFDPTAGTWGPVDPPSGGGPGGAVASVAGKTGNVTLVKGDVGLGNVDNTADANKPVSGPQQTALNGKADLQSGKIPTSQLPALAITEYLGTANSNSVMLALTGQRGDFVTRTDTTVMADGLAATGDWILVGDDATVLGNWHRLSSPSTASGGVTSVAGKLGPAVTLVKGDVGLGNVDNTADLTKPLSNAAVSALAAKAALPAATMTSQIRLPVHLIADRTTGAYPARPVGLAAYYKVVWCGWLDPGPSGLGLMVDEDEWSQEPAP